MLGRSGLNPERLGRSALILALLFTAACSREYDSPFVPRSQPPRADDDLIFMSNGYGKRGDPREVFGLKQDGSVERLTFCSSSGRPCDTVEAVVSPEGQRLVVRRIAGGASDDDAELTYLDLTRGVEGPLLPSTAKVSGMDWSPTSEVIAYSAVGEGGIEDLFRIDSNGQNARNLTATPTLRERRPRIDPTGSTAAFERIDASGKSQIYVLGVVSLPVTSGGIAGDPLPGTPYVVGSDADPDYSPDGQSIVFRRLTSANTSGGNWDILTVKLDGSGLTPIASGPSYRGAPDWGSQGIAFTEMDAQRSTISLISIQPDGSGRRTRLGYTSLLNLSIPRWLGPRP